DGGFLAQWAGLNRGHNFIGVERLLGRLRKLERKGRRAQLENLRMLRIEAGYFLQYLIPPQTVTALHIYFPDPWPKRKHHGRRLLTPSFVQVTGAALVPGGTIYLRTDDRLYFQAMIDCFGGSPLFSSVATPDHLAAVLTDFERVFTARGISTLRAAYQRRSA
ncbi:MAG TPA: tRNA (guanosine(46)-N7)-methyltransferase TrmB, partial [Verrucomicrobiae bacterium]|nr:tRNA (guanosine(46)-N7)-methyltransferase TrmB [Verrucomicrobiae bacterium]